MNLSEKIASLEEYRTVSFPDGNSCTDYFRGYRSSPLSGDIALWTSMYWPTVADNNYYNPQAVDRVPVSAWWAHREIARQHYGVYEPLSAVLAHLITVNTHVQQMFLHISRDDPAMVAFTATPEDGQRDKQTKMALGRFLRRYFPLMSDKHIGALEAQHRSELNPNVKLHSFQDEFDKCLKIYTAVQSCMSKSISSYSSGGEHPMSAYCTPGFFLATLYDADDRVKARNIVWINPTDENDKRWVRNYGDAALLGWLKRNNFKEKSLSGAYLRTKVIGEWGGGQSNAHILCPYVDIGTNTEGGNRTAHDKNGYGLWDGKDRIYLISNHEASNKFKGRAHGVQSTSGHVIAKPFKMRFTSIVSGKEYSGLDHTATEVYVDGKYGDAIASEIAEWPRYSDGKGKVIHCAPGTPKFDHGGYSYIESDATRAVLGYIKLDAAMYPNEQNWLLLTADMTKLADGRYVKMADTVYLIDGKKLERVLQAELPKDAERAASIESVKTFVTTGTESVRTKDNRRVVPGVHPIVQLYDQTWVYERHAVRTTLFGASLWVPKTMTTADYANIPMDTVIGARVANIVRAYDTQDKAEAAAVFKLLCDRGDLYLPIAVKNDKFSWGYAFEPDGVNLSVVKAFLATPIDLKKNLDATQGAVERFHSLAPKVLASVASAWSKKPSAKAKPVAVAA